MRKQPRPGGLMQKKCPSQTRETPSDTATKPSFPDTRSPCPALKGPRASTLLSEGGGGGITREGYHEIQLRKCRRKDMTLNDSPSRPTPDRGFVIAIRTLPLALTLAPLCVPFRLVVRVVYKAAKDTNENFGP